MTNEQIEKLQEELKAILQDPDLTYEEFINCAQALASLEAVRRGSRRFA